MRCKIKMEWMRERMRPPLLLKNIGEKSKGSRRQKKPPVLRQMGADRLPGLRRYLIGSDFSA